MKGVTSMEKEAWNKPYGAELQPVVIVWTHGICVSMCAHTCVYTFTYIHIYEICNIAIHVHNHTHIYLFYSSVCWQNN